jgi:hypothetical protein
MTYVINDLGQFIKGNHDDQWRATSKFNRVGALSYSIPFPLRSLHDSVAFIEADIHYFRKDRIPLGAGRLAGTLEITCNSGKVVVNDPTGGDDGVVVPGGDVKVFYTDDNWSFLRVFLTPVGHLNDGLGWVGYLRGCNAGDKWRTRMIRASNDVDTLYIKTDEVEFNLSYQITTAS